jgi:hypothetical protein
MIGQSDIAGFVTESGAKRMPRNLVSHLLGFVGAVLGAALGFYIVGWLAGHAFYGMMIPGALLGGGCGLLARHPSEARGIVCGICALVFALFNEWWYFPFLGKPGEGHETLAYFASHLTNLTTLTWFMVAFGALIAYWLGRDAGIGRSRLASGPRNPAPSP